VTCIAGAVPLQAVTLKDWCEAEEITVPCPLPVRSAIRNVGGKAELMPRLKGLCVCDDLTPRYSPLIVKLLLPLGGSVSLKEAYPETKGLTVGKGKGKTLRKPRT